MLCLYYSTRTTKSNLSYRPLVAFGILLRLERVIVVKSHCHLAKKKTEWQKLLEHNNSPGNKTVNVPSS